MLIIVMQRLSLHDYHILMQAAAESLRSSTTQDQTASQLLLSVSMQIMLEVEADRIASIHPRAEPSCSSHAPASDTVSCPSDRCSTVVIVL